MRYIFRAHLLPMILALGSWSAVLAAVPPLASAQTDRVPAGATWVPVFPGVRATAMGTADVAGARDADAVFLNAAPLPPDADLVAVGDRQEFVADGNLDALAVGGRLGAWRFTVATSTFELKDTYGMSFPDTADYRERTIIGGVAFDLGPALDMATGTSLVVGANVRRFDGKREDWQTGLTGLDIGLTLGATMESPTSRRVMSFTVAAQNITDGDLDGDAEGGKLAQRTQLGATLDWIHLKGDSGQESFTVTAAAGYEFRTRVDDVWKVGMEFVLARLVSLRGGHNQGIQDGTFSWGVGVVLDKFTGEKVDLSLDYGRIRYGLDEASEQDLDMFGLRAGFRFD